MLINCGFGPIGCNKAFEPRPFPGVLWICVQYSSKHAILMLVYGLQA